MTQVFPEPVAILNREPTKVLRRQVLNAVGVEFGDVPENLPAAVHRRLEFDGLPHSSLLRDLREHLHQLLRIVAVLDFNQVDQRLDGLTLAEMVAEGRGKAGNLVVLVKPVFKQPECDFGRARIALPFASDPPPCEAWQ